MASHIPVEAVHDTTPLSRFLVLRIFTALLRHLLSAPFCLLQSTSQFFLPLFQQLHEPQLVSPLPLLLVSCFSTAFNFSPASTSTDDHTLCLTIQIISWQRTVQGILLCSNPYYCPPALVTSLLCYPCCTLLRTPSIDLLHSAGFPCSPMYLLLL